MEPGQTAYKKTLAHFGTRILQENSQQINRPEQDHARPGAQVSSSWRHFRVPQRHEARRSRYPAAVRIESRQVLFEIDRCCVLERPASGAPDGAQQLLARSGSREDQRAAAARCENRKSLVRHR
ncbi:hypothetical protein AYI70_g6653 [Smittium culicis]|uniref:Uncharacterized protein n=1 Tax=Smittium culicis TaxID=133412 RepID=A0A1R1XNZ1_9FUNG|nr:hypothetical protein AYI70_g6653 [Smittium culicis]